MRAVSAGKTNARATTNTSDPEIGELAQAFNSMLDRLETIRREQAMLILQAQEEERRRVALELHDESSQNLTALLVYTEVLSQSLRDLPETVISKNGREQLSRELQHLTGLTQHTLENIRALAQQLRPSVLDDLGLHAAFRWLAEDSRERLKLVVELHMEGVEDTSRGNHHPALYETTLFRIAQECLTNVARHAHAQRVSISLTRDEQNICLQVHDDGHGFDVSQHSGLGIVGMHERAALLGGTITIVSRPGQGTTVEAVLPVSTSMALIQRSNGTRYDNAGEQNNPSTVDPTFGR
jgi:two-component system sensor histidine kinase UhpB